MMKVYLKQTRVGITGFQDQTLHKKYLFYL